MCLSLYVTKMLKVLLVVHVITDRHVPRSPVLATGVSVPVL